MTTQQHPLYQQIVTKLMQEAREFGLIGQEILDYLEVIKKDGLFDQLILDEERRLELEEISKKYERVTQMSPLKIK